MKFYKTILVLLIVLLFQNSGYSQNFIQNFLVNNNNDQIKLSLTTQNKFQYEIIPFESRVYTLIKLKPVLFQLDSKKEFIASLKNLPITIQVLELMDDAIMLTFKNISANQLQVKTTNAKIDIFVHPKPIENLITKNKSNLKQAENHYLSAVQFSKNNENSKAISEIHKALRFKSNYAEAYFLAGEIRFQKGEWKKAKFNFNKAKTLDPNVGDIREYIEKIEKQLNPQISTNNKNLDEKREPEEENIEPDTSIAEFESMTNLDTMKINSAQINNSEKVINYQVPNEKESSQVESTSYPQFEQNTNYLQFIFFLLIVFSLAAWIVLLWKKRKQLPGLKKEKIPNFETLLDQLHKRQKTIGNDMPELNENIEEKIEESSQDFKNRTKMEKPLNIFNMNKYEKKDNLKYQNSFTKFDNIVPSKKENFRENSELENKVLELVSMGFSVEEIAKKLQLGKGEIQLILNFRGKKVPESASRLRIEMD